MSTSVIAEPQREQRAITPKRSAPHRARRICIIGDNLSGNLDEGVKIFTVRLAESLKRQNYVSLISTSGPDTILGAQYLPVGETLISRHLRDELRERKPDTIIYATRRSATFFAFVRARLLRLYYPNARFVMFGFQTRRHSLWQRTLIRLMHPGPDLVCVQSRDNYDYLKGLGCQPVLLPSGVDIERFRPVAADRRDALRAKFGFTAGRTVLLHVGHLNEGRGVRLLADLAKLTMHQVVLVASTSSAQEEHLAAELRMAGVRVITSFQPRIEELYQAADCYIFPVTSTNNAIEAPLSVFEAMSCGLPVISTRFASLMELFPTDTAGIRFVDGVREFVSEINRAARQRQDTVSATRELVLPFSWDAVAERLTESLDALSQPAVA